MNIKPECFDFDDLEPNSETECSDNEQNEDICNDELSYIENEKFRLLFDPILIQYLRNYVF